MSELDNALDALAGTGAEWHGGLSNHGPMCAEAMHVLGHDDAIAPWVARYRPRLEAGPQIERTPIVSERWSDALGDANRIGDWNAHFDRELSDHEPHDVLRNWVPRLATGLMAAERTARYASPTRPEPSGRTPPSPAAASSWPRSHTGRRDTRPSRRRREPEGG